MSACMSVHAPRMRANTDRVVTRGGGGSEISRWNSTDHLAPQTTMETEDQRAERDEQTKVGAVRGDVTRFLFHK